MKFTVRGLRGSFFRSLFDHYPIELLKRQTDDQVAQRVLHHQYRADAQVGRRSTFAEVGFRRYSQFEEDGILLYLFSIIEPHNRTCVEMCAGDGMECNTTNLIVNHGWWGQLFDGNADSVSRGQAFFSHHKDTFLHPPGFRHAWITAENVNQLIADTGVTGRVDLLSLDLDGVDYWVWKAITVIDPTVVVCETQNQVPPDVAVTVPYAPDFCLTDFTDDFRGASLRAMVHLGRSKGYRLVGTHRYGFNAFFVKNGMADDMLPEVTPESCSTDPYTTRAHRTRWPRVKDRPWVHV